MNRPGDKMFKGIFAPIPTPFDERGEIEWNALSDNLTWWGQTSLQGLVVAGTNGEAVLLDHEEKVKAFYFVRENLPSEKVVIAGTGCESAKATVSLNNAAAGSGVNAVLVLNPSYYKSSMKDELLIDYYHHIAECSPLPVILYNMPRNTNVNLNAKLVVKLSKHPNIVGIKDSSGNIAQIGEIIKNSDNSFSVFAGSADFLLPALLLGANGGTLALANVMPEECSNIYRLHKEGNLKKATNEQLNILEINNAVTARYGVAGLKAAMELIGLYGGPPRLPLAPLGSEEKQQLKETMHQCRLL